MAILLCRCLALAALPLSSCFLVARAPRAKMCRSVAAYPLECPPDRVRARMFRPTGSFTHSGQEVRSLCVAEQDGRQVVCTETDGAWDCSMVFQALR